MADLTDLQSAQTVKIAGANPSSGIEDNFADVDSNGNILVKDYSDGLPGSTAPLVTTQIGGMDKNGKLQTANVDTQGVQFVRYFNNGQVDVLQNLKIDQSFPIFTNTFTYDLQPNFWSTSVTGTGTVTNNSNISSAIVAVAAANDVAIIESKRAFLYTPGVSRTSIFTGKFGTAITNVIQRIGLFDSNDGVFFELNGTTLNAVIRSSTSGSPVDTDIAQSIWNTDKLDGTGASGYTLDLTKGQVMYIDYSWLGWNKVRFGFIINGELIIAHVATFSNTSTVPWASTGHFNFRAEVRTTVLATVSMQFTCVSILDGAPRGNRITVPRSVSTTSLKSILPATLTPVLSVRLDPTKPKSIIIPRMYTVLSSSGDGGSCPYEARLVLNGTLTGASFGALTNSNAQSDTSATAISSGIQIDSTFGNANITTQAILEENIAGQSTSNNQFILNYDDLNAVADVLTLAIFAQAPISILASIDWEEE